MTKQLKEDIKTIIQILSYLLIIYITSLIFFFQLINIIFFILIIGARVWSGYFIKYRKDVVLFPTLNDEASKMTFISFGVLILMFFGVDYFVFTPNIYLIFIGFGFGGLVFLFGFFESSKGWIKINNNSLRLYGIKDNIDIRQLKIITLAANKITLTSIYDENKNSFQLKLDPFAAQKIKTFLSQNLLNKGVLIVDNVTALS
ncbi:hypothetical protein HDF24_24505 [Mucilaginibacter sp. X4EP1]|uniref:hypothetical protein n=1 Tax=Mucilaginibacter sp. X4EP1 TaxID=2723092 RepID=UPI002169C6A0|nr:hypothetical protein [Mucilaginibacter sp. X4EP1]MCS3815233.1 hypothetical protein [Mucilaginibacter sp. X4EP1]